MRTSHSVRIPSGKGRWLLGASALLALALVATQVMGASGAAAGGYNSNLTGIRLASFELQCPAGPGPVKGGRGCVHHQTRSSFRVEPLDGGTSPRKVRTAKDGRALVKLPPGNYRIRPLIIYRHHRALGPAPPPQEITVKPDHFAAVIVDYSGPQPG